MAKIRAFALPPRLAEKLKAQIPDFPNELLSTFGRECLQGGFRNPAAIRERLRAFVDSPAALPTGLVAFLADCVRHRLVVRTLSAGGLAIVFDLYAAVLERDELLLALLVDAREDVHRLGVDLQKLPGETLTEEDRAASREMLRDLLGRTLLTPCGIKWQEGPPAAGSPDKVPGPAIPSGDLMSEMRQTIAYLHKKIMELEADFDLEKAKHRKKSEEHQKRLAEERERFAAAREEEKKRASQLEHELTRTRQAHKKLEETFEARLTAKLAEETSLLARKWLGDAICTDPERGPAEGTEDLLARCESLMHEQEQQDRLTGNRVRLQQRLAALEAMRQRMLEALATALNPLTSLRGILPQVEAEIAAVQKRLGAGKAGDEVTAHFLAHINAAENWEELRWYARLVEDLAGKSFLTAQGARRIADQLHRKISILEERLRGPAPELDTGWSLRGRIHRNEATALLIDGHNLLFGLEDIFGAWFEEGYPRRKAREALAASARTLAGDRLQLAVRIFFDGPELNVVPVAPNISIQYSGGTGANRADAAIAGHLRAKTKEIAGIGQKAFVVSDDREVRREALAAGAKFVPVNVFAVLLQDFGCLKTEGAL